MEKILTVEPRKGKVKTSLPEPWNEIEVHTPTVKDRVKAYSLLKNIGYDSLPEEFKLVEFTRTLIFTMIDKPQVTWEQWLTLDDVAVSIICQKVTEWWNKEIEAFIKELDFLVPKKQSLAT